VPLQAASSTGLQAGAVTARYDNSGATVPNVLVSSMEVTDDRETLGDSPFALIVEDDPAFAAILLDIAREAGLKGVVATAGAGTLALARKLQPHVITLDLGLSDIDGLVLLDLLKHDPQTTHIPVQVISGAEKLRSALPLGALGITEKPATQQQLAGVFAELARTVREGLASRSHAVAPVSNDRGKALHAAPDLVDAKVLIVDDDIRNIYSLTSVLESYGMQVLHAEAGRDGIALLELHPDIDVALIDIMMPEMDGYETMQKIRARSSIAAVPLIAVTAKAMKGDRQKCLDAGASDYIAKPVDIELLLALLRVWVANSPRRIPVEGP
jgi:CheY-like chemotaxis protein